MERYYVWWPWLTSKRVAQVCQHQLSFLFVIPKKYHKSSCRWQTHKCLGSRLRCSETFQNFLTWAEPEPKTAKFLVSCAQPTRTRNSAIADKPPRRVYTSVNITKHSTIPYVRHSFLLCNSNFVFKTRHFYDIRLQKCRDLENWVRVRQGHWKCHHVIERIWLLIDVL